MQLALLPGCCQALPQVISFLVAGAFCFLLHIVPLCFGVVMAEADDHELTPSEMVRRLVDDPRNTYIQALFSNSYTRPPGCRQGLGVLLLNAILTTHNGRVGYREGHGHLPPFILLLFFLVACIFTSGTSLSLPSLLLIYVVSGSFLRRWQAFALFLIDQFLLPLFFELWGASSNRFSSGPWNLSVKQDLSLCGNAVPVQVFLIFFTTWPGISLPILNFSYPAYFMVRLVEFKSPIVH